MILHKKPSPPKSFHLLLPGAEQEESGAVMLDLSEKLVMEARALMLPDELLLKLLRGSPLMAKSTQVFLRTDWAGDNCHLTSLSPPLTNMELK